MAAPRRTASTASQTEAGSRSAGLARPVSLPMKLLREQPIRTGIARLGEAARAGNQFQLLRDASCRSRSRDRGQCARASRRPLRRPPRGRAGTPGCPRQHRHRPGQRRCSSGRPRRCIRITSASFAATSGSIASSSRKAEMSFTIRAPASSAARATEARRVSTEIVRPCRASPSTTGRMRCSSSCGETWAATLAASTHPRYRRCRHPRRQNAGHRRWPAPGRGVHRRPKRNQASH
jgi:hypothetical protein